MSYFGNSVRYLVKSILAPVDRVYSSTIDLIESLLAPLQDLFNEWSTFDNEIRIRSRFNGQVIVMRKALEYITGKTGVTITISRRPEEGFLYLESETLEPEQYFYLDIEGVPYYLFLESENAVDFSFVIGIPAPLTTQIENKIVSEISSFGLPIQNYTIEEI